MLAALAFLPLPSLAADGISLFGGGVTIPVIPEPAPDVPPKVVEAIQPVFTFPFILVGSVDIDFVVDSTGRVVNPYIVRSTNPWLERPTIEAILKWRFSPAMKGGEPVAAKASQRMKCDPTLYRFPGDSSPWKGRKEKGHKSLPDELRWDDPPVSRDSAFPYYPREALMKENNGRASIRLRISPAGIVVDSSITKATTPEFGGAALAAIDNWRFIPAKRHGQPCSAIVTINFKFDTVPGTYDVPIAYSTKLAARELLRKTPRIVDLAHLDQAPRAISRRLPPYPSSLRADGKPGKAEVEYLVDKNGDAQLPVVVSASRPEFGYAAAQAVSSWLFEPPLQHDRPVMTRCRASFSFFPPPGPDFPGDTNTLLDPPSDATRSKS
ncbi:MAG TPA: TonB family protein [Candidatus Didemnitutus sp.]|nr:TonB family protein [Candidatus Didemnitutus sp.]